jgi:riboflavin biosynthesis pyrimidine reductase
MMQIPEYKNDDIFFLLALDEEKKAWKSDPSSIYIGYALLKENQILQKGYLKVLSKDTLSAYTGFFRKCPPNCIVYFSKEIKFLKNYPLIIKIIKEKNIHILSSLSEEATIFNESCNYFKKTSKPFVMAGLAQTLDGKITLGNLPTTITSQVANFHMHKKRFIADIIVTTAQTVINDNPKLNARIDKLAFSKKIAIIDSKRRITGNENLFLEAEEVHIFSKIHKPILNKKNTVFFHQTPRDNQNVGIDGAWVFNEIVKLGHTIIWLEAGAKFMQYVHHHNLINKTYLYIAPKVIGGEGPTIYGSNFLLNPPPFYHKLAFFGDGCCGYF